MEHKRIPVFYDTTLRDGNQSLKKPWGISEKQLIFNKLLELNIPAIEIGFPAANETEYNSCLALAQQAPKDLTVSVFARSHEEDIKKAAMVLKDLTHPRIQLVLAMNPTGLKYVLHKNIQEAIQTATHAIKFAKSLLSPNGVIAFGIEHFGDCSENLPNVLQAIDQIIDAGANVIVLPNTVERTHPSLFVEMIKKAKEAVGNRAEISVHCHNDLGMATATTVESFFAGVNQMETTINGIGERCGNTNMFEVAMALYNAGIKIPLNMNKFYDTALFLSKMSGIPIHEKAPLMGQDCFTHRSGMHQDGATKTSSLTKRQYLPYLPEIIGRTDGEKISFTSQSGTMALRTICAQNGYDLTNDQLSILVPKAKHLALQKGELSFDDMVDLCLKSSS